MSIIDFGTCNCCGKNNCIISYHPWIRRNGLICKYCAERLLNDMIEIRDEIDFNEQQQQESD